MWLNGDETAEMIVEYLAVADRRRADRLLTRWAEGGRLRPALASGPAGHVRVRPAARFRPGGLSNLRRDLGGHEPDFWNNVRKLRPLPDPLRSLQQRPAAVALAVAGPPGANGVKRWASQAAPTPGSEPHPDRPQPLWPVGLEAADAQVEESVPDPGDRQVEGELRQLPLLVALPDRLQVGGEGRPR